MPYIEMSVWGTSKFRSAPHRFVDIQMAYDSVSLLEASQCLFYTLHRLNDVLVRCSIADTEALWRTEVVTANGCNVSHLKQVHGKVCCVADDTIAVFLAKVAGALWEKVEGSLWLVYFESGDFLGEFHDEVLAALEGEAHIFYALLVSSECCFGCFL